MKTKITIHTGNTHRDRAGTSLLPDNVLTRFWPPLHVREPVEDFGVPNAPKDWIDMQYESLARKQET